MALAIASVQLYQKRITNRPAQRRYQNQHQMRAKCMERLSGPGSLRCNQKGNSTMPTPIIKKQIPKPSSSPQLAKSCCSGCNTERKGENCYRCSASNPEQRPRAAAVACYCGQAQEMRDAPPLDCFSAMREYGGGEWVWELWPDLAPMVPKPPAQQPDAGPMYGENIGPGY